MMSSNLFITVASWEDRFLLGFKRIINKSHITDVQMYYFEEYAERTSKHRQAVKDLCTKKNIKINDYQISFRNSAESWKTIYKNMAILESAVNVTVDITTMPREVIWTVFSLIDTNSVKASYFYHKPASYDEEWLTRDPAKPRLVYKLAGMTKLGVSTALLILTGYDVDRVQQLINFFDPSITLLGIQKGKQLNNLKLNIEKSKKYEKEPGIKLFYLDAYCPDHGFAEIEEHIQPYIETTNLVMSSLGPKLSAIALYKVNRKYPDAALAYAPSREFNPEYSHGIGKTFTGSL